MCLMVGKNLKSIAIKVAERSKKLIFLVDAKTLQQFN